jgi:glucuronate isomerase
MLRSSEFSNNGILSRFNIEYQSPVATLLENISYFDGAKVAPSLRADELLLPTEAFKKELAEKSGIAVSDDKAYIKAICVMLDRFSNKGCRFADHSLDARFFEEDTDGKKTEMLVRLGNEYAKRGWTLLLHMNAKRHTSPRLHSIAGPAGGFATPLHPLPSAYSPEGYAAVAPP